MTCTAIGVFVCMCYCCCVKTGKNEKTRASSLFKNYRTLIIAYAETTKFHVDTWTPAGPCNFYHLGHACKAYRYE